MNDTHKPRHDEPRRPLRLTPLPRPKRAQAAPESEESDAPRAEPASEWIHEWSQPEPISSTDA